MTLVSEFIDLDEAGLQAYFRKMNWTDGLPVVIPTRKLVDDFLDASGFAAHREALVGEIPLSNSAATVDLVAVNAVMAGCEPIHLPYVLGAVEAMSDPSFSLSSVQATTNPVAPLVIISGPAGGVAGVASGTDALGPGQKANGPIGRAVRLVMRNVGRGVEGVDQAAFGQPAKYSFCLGESVSDSPWDPLHVSRGFAVSDNVVTVFAIENVINVIPTMRRGLDLSESWLHHMAQVMRSVGANLIYSSGSPVVVLNPRLAESLLSSGYDRGGLQTALFERARLSSVDRPWGNSDFGHWKEDDDGSALAFAQPSDISIIVAGGASLHSLYLQPWYASAACSRRVWNPVSGRDTVGQ